MKFAFIYKTILHQNQKIPTAVIVVISQKETYFPQKIIKYLV